jgi:S-formylglutathione hydrolase
MTQVDVFRFDVFDPTHGQVPCSLIMPAAVTSPLPLCLYLYGGGGSRESTIELAPLLADWWRAEQLPPLAIATADVGPWSFYLDDPARGLAWESFVAERFVEHLRGAYPIQPEPAATALVGNSMGGYGALKIALSRPHAFAAVAAISPMVEPAREASEVRPRNRYHYPPEVPQALVGSPRDPALYRRDQPVARACTHSEELRGGALAIYIDAAGRDALYAHDGAEYLHRVLWSLDVEHEYRLRRDSDHVGPDLLQRLREAFAWAGSHVSPRALSQLSEQELAWQRWLQGASSQAPAAPLSPTSPLFPLLLRRQLAGLRAAAERLDASVARRYGVLPPEPVPETASGGV